MLILVGSSNIPLREYLKLFVLETTDSNTLTTFGRSASVKVAGLAIFCTLQYVRWSDWAG